MTPATFAANLANGMPDTATCAPTSKPSVWPTSTIRCRSLAPGTIVLSAPRVRSACTVSEFQSCIFIPGQLRNSKREPSEISSAPVLLTDESLPPKLLGLKMDRSILDGTSTSNEGTVRDSSRFLRTIESIEEESQQACLFPLRLSRGSPINLRPCGPTHRTAMI